MPGGGDAERARRLLPQFAQRRQLSVDLVKSWADAAQQALARLGRGDAAGGAHQQPKPEPLFESTDGVAQRRLRDADLAGGSGEASLPRHGEEGEKVVDVLARHS